MVFKLNPIACRSNIIRFLSFSWFDFGLDLSKFDTIDFIHKIEERKKKHVSQCIRSIGECSTVVRLAQFVYWPLVYSRFTFGFFYPSLRCVAISHTMNCAIELIYCYFKTSSSYFIRFLRNAATWNVLFCFVDTLHSIESITGEIFQCPTKIDTPTDLEEISICLYHGQNSLLNWFQILFANVNVNVCVYNITNWRDRNNNVLFDY